MVRPYKTSDKNSLADIFKQNTPKYFDPKELDDFLEYLEQYKDTYLTIESEGKIVGGIGYYIKESDKSGRITWMFFHPNYSGLGLGTKAVEYCFKMLIVERSVEKYMVRTSQYAYRFFEKFGFKTVKTEKDYWGKGLDLFEMERIK